MKVELQASGMRKSLQDVADDPMTANYEMVQIELVKATAMVQMMQDLNDIKHIFELQQTVAG